MEAVKAERLTKSFGNVQAVSGVTFSVAPGEIFGLVGADGAGKTTTIRLLASIMLPDSGNAWVMGRHTVRDAEALRDNIGYMSQRFGLYPDLTVMENLNFFADIYTVPKREREPRAERLLEFSKLGPFKKRPAKNLSGGMKQKLGLMCALIHTPKVLFLDEPTNGVDPISRRDFWRILYQLLKEGVTIFISTSYLDEAERCTRIGLIQKGKLLACDTPANVKKLMRGSIVEISTSENRRAVEIIKASLPPEKVNLFGSRIHVATDEPESLSNRVRKLLQTEGIPVEEICSIPPSLEDTLIDFINRESSAAS